MGSCCGFFVKTVIVVALGGARLRRISPRDIKIGDSTVGTFISRVGDGGLNLRDFAVIHRSGIFTRNF